VALPLFIRVINVINSVIGVPLPFPSLHILAVNGVAGAPLPFPLLLVLVLS
jgi:hypothetical protein